jgi:hypothetical protein
MIQVAGLGSREEAQYLFESVAAGLEAVTGGLCRS